jgi:hypothetical protein
LSTYRPSEWTTRAVAKQHDAVPEARVRGVLLGSDLAVGEPEENLPVPRHETAVDLRPHDQDVAILSGADHRVGQLQTPQKPRALLPDVETRHIGQPQFPGKDRTGAREVEVGGHRREDDVPDLALIETRIAKGLLGGGHRKVAGGLVEAREPPGDDPGPLPDPLVRGVHQPGQVVVVHHVVGDIHPRSRHLRAHPVLRWSPDSRPAGEWCQSACGRHGAKSTNSDPFSAKRAVQACWKHPIDSVCSRMIAQAISPWPPVRHKIAVLPRGSEGW